ncbi:MAG: tetratricopeptide repeat protein [Candidatus Hydrogenedentes bacterium]|nr:tetratricopeptide repeat protein [Candidatus Hydrogenedentota bacterium]
MRSNDAKERFSMADAYYRKGRYEEALALLDELNAAFPNTANILFPRARCMRRLGRTQEALHICGVLLKHFNDPRAEKLRRAIEKDLATPRLDDTADEPLLPNISLDDILGPPPPPPLPPPPEKFARPDWLSTPVIIVLSVVAALVLITVLAMVTGGGGNSTGATEATQTAASQPEPVFRITEDLNIVLFGWQLSWVGWLVISIVLTTTQYTISLYLTLRTGNKLPNDDLQSDLINIGIMSFIGTLMNTFVPCLGYIGSIIMLRRTYELVFLEFFILFSFYIATCIVAFGLLFLVGLGLAMAAGAA